MFLMLVSLESQPLLLMNSCKLNFSIRYIAIIVTSYIRHVSIIMLGVGTKRHLN
jgi:hypothetical protein